MRRMRLRSFLRIRRCVLYQLVMCVFEGFMGGEYRSQASWLSLFMGLCWKVGSSQCLRGDPSIRWALLHDLVVRSVRCGGRFSVD